MAASCMEPMVSPFAEYKGPVHSKPTGLLPSYVEPDGQHIREGVDTEDLSLVFRGGTYGFTCGGGDGGGEGEHAASQPSSV